MSQVTIRRADEHDFDAICAVLVESAQLHATALPHVFQSPSVSAFPREYLLEHMTAPDRAVFVACVDEAVVGVLELASLKAEGPGRTTRSYVSLSDIAVLTTHRGKGIGTKLADHALKWAKESGASSIELNVWDFNEEAIRFYERLGYSTQRRIMTRQV